MGSEIEEKRFLSPLIVDQISLDWVSHRFAAAISARWSSLSRGEDLLVIDCLPCPVRKSSVSGKCGLLKSPGNRDPWLYKYPASNPSSLLH
jgi:hypothetical protein